MSKASLNTESRYLPPLRFRALTRFYDPIVRLLTRDQYLKARIIDVLSPQPGERILDLACGTGTLAILVKESQPTATVAGVDLDRQALAIASRKASRASVEVRWQRGNAVDPPFVDGSFDAVVSSLAFHHLSSDEKNGALQAVLRLLVPGGRFLLADFTRSSNQALRLLFAGVRRLDGRERTEDHALGRIPSLLDRAGFHFTSEVERMDTPTGTIALVTAFKPARSMFEERL